MNQKQMQLPEGWMEKPLSNVLNVIRGISFKSSEKLIEPNEDSVICLRTANVQDVTEWDDVWHVPQNFVKRKEQFLKEHDIVISNANSYELVGKVSYITSVPNKSTLGAFITLLRNGDAISSKFYFYQLRSARVVNEIRSKASTTTNISNVSSGKLKEIPLYEAPYKQQKQIVAKIEELFSHIDAGIESLKIAKQKLKQYRQSVLKAAVTGELTKDWREQNANAKQGCSNVAGGTTPGVTESANQLLKRIQTERRQRWEQQKLSEFQAKGKPPKNDKWKERYKPLSELNSQETEKLTGLPESWIYSKLGNLIDEPKYGTSKKCSYESSGTAVLRIPNVANGFIDSVDLKFAEFDSTEMETYKLIENDVLTIRSNGSVNLVGKCALVRKFDTDFLYAGYLIRLRANQELLLGTYLINCMNSILLRNQVESKAKSTSGVNNINAKELQDLIIPICSIEEQKEIVQRVEEKLTAADRLMAELDTKLTQAQQQKQTILASAFNGRLM